MKMIKDLDIVYESGALSGINNIPTDFPIHGLNLFTNLVGDTGAAVTPDPESPQSIIERVEFFQDGEAIINVDGESLAMIPYYYRKTEPIHNLITAINQDNVALGFSDAELLFDAVGLYPENLSMAIGGRNRNWAVRIKWLTQAALGGGYTLDSANMSVARLPEYNYLVHNPVQKRIMTQVEPVIATSSKLRIKFPTSGLYQFILLKQEIGGLPVENIINSISIWLGGTSYLSKDVPLAQWHSNTRYLANLPKLTTSFPTIPASINVNNFGLPLGYVMIDLTDFSGKWADLFNAYNLADFAIELDVTLQAGVNTIKSTYCVFDKLPV